MSSKKKRDEDFERLAKVGPKVDTGPPLYNARVTLRRLRDDTNAYNRITDDNIALLDVLNCIMRTTGKVQTFRDKSPPRISRVQEIDARFRRLEEENRQLGSRIMAAKTVLDTWHSKQALSNAKWHTRSQHIEVFTYPDKILQKYKDLDVPKDGPELRQLLRPVITLNLGIKDLRPLGRITIQLYTEASPQVVIEFMRFAAAGKPEKLLFRRLFKRLWLEGELELSDNSLINDNIEYDYRALNHGSHVGILSYSLSNLTNTRNSTLSFTISFKPLRVLNGRRVAFGHVTYGATLLETIQDYGTKNGKPIRQIVCLECGVDKKRS